MNVKKNALIIFLFLSQIAVSQTFKRVVSFSPAATFNLNELKAEDKIVGCTNYCTLAESRKDLIVGSTMGMNIEKLIASKPDLVIYTTLFKPSQIERIKNMGIAVELFDSPKNYKETCDQFIRLGKLIDKKDFALQYIDSCNKIMDSILQKIPKTKKYKMFFELGSKPLFTVVPNTFMHDYMTILGAENIANDQEGGTITRERVLLKNPDIIILVNMGTVTQKEKDVWKSYKNLSATKNKQIHIIDASLACQATPRNFLNTILELKRLIYGAK